jgi:hypothetical protein
MRFMWVPTWIVACFFPALGWACLANIRLFDVPAAHNAEIAKAERDKQQIVG